MILVHQFRISLTFCLLSETKRFQCTKIYFFALFYIFVKISRLSQIKRKYVV